MHTDETQIKRFKINREKSVLVCGEIQTSNFAAKNGLCCFSSTTVVMGPCPGQIIVSPGKVRIFSRLFFKASRYDTLPPPIEPAKSESPTMAMGFARPVTT